MFGLTLGKLLVLVGLVLAAWYGFKFVARVQQVRAGDQRRAAGARRAAPSIGVEDMTKCATCGSYVTRAARSCGRADCPFGA